MTKPKLELGPIRARKYEWAVDLTLNGKKVTDRERQLYLWVYETVRGRYQKK